MKRTSFGKVIVILALILIGILGGVMLARLLERQEEISAVPDHRVTFDYGEFQVKIVVPEGSTIGDRMPADPKVEADLQHCAAFSGWYDGETRITSETIVLRDFTAKADIRTLPFHDYRMTGTQQDYLGHNVFHYVCNSCAFEADIVEHLYKREYEDGRPVRLRCTICGATVPYEEDEADHEHVLRDGYCTECGKFFVSIDEDEEGGGGTGKDPSDHEHYDGDGDEICDGCGQVMPDHSEHRDSNGDGYCDVCHHYTGTQEEEPSGHEHYDEDGDWRCDECSKAMNSVQLNPHADAESSNSDAGFYDAFKDTLSDLSILEQYSSLHGEGDYYYPLEGFEAEHDVVIANYQIPFYDFPIVFTLDAGYNYLRDMALDGSLDGSNNHREMYAGGERCLYVDKSESGGTTNWEVYYRFGLEEDLEDGMYRPGDGFGFVSVEYIVHDDQSGSYTAFENLDDSGASEDGREVSGQFIFQRDSGLSWLEIRIKTGLTAPLAWEHWGDRDAALRVWAEGVYYCGDYDCFGESVYEPGVYVIKAEVPFTETFKDMYWQDKAGHHQLPVYLRRESQTETGFIYRAYFRCSGYEAIKKAEDCKIIVETKPREDLHTAADIGDGPIGPFLFEPFSAPDFCFFLEEDESGLSVFFFAVDEYGAEFSPENFTMHYQQFRDVTVEPDALVYHTSRRAFFFHVKNLRMSDTASLIEVYL